MNSYIKIFLVIGQCAILKKGCVEETVGDRRREENGDMDWRNNGGSRRSSITSDNIRHFNKFLLKQIHFSNELSQRKFLICSF